MTAGDVGKSIRVEVTATNAAGTNAALSAESAAVEAGTPPSNTSKPTISGTPADNHTVTASPGSWSGDTPISYAYQWKRCNSSGGSCSNLSGKTGKSYEVRSADDGHTLRVLVTATNAAGSGTALSDRVTVVRLDKPRNTSIPTISGTPADNHTLTANRGRWSSDTSIDYDYQWERCSAAGGDCDKLSGRTKQTYEVTSSDEGHTLRVRVTATNSAGSTTAVSNPITVQTAKPLNTSRPTISGNLTPGQALTASPGAWTGTSGTSYSYSWVRCTAEGKSCKAVGSGQTYRVTTADVGQRLFVKVSARNASGSGEADSALTPVIQPNAPVSRSRPGIAGTSREGETLRATNGDWSSSVKLTYFYQWARCNSSGANCFPITGATKPTYTLVSADVGHRLIVQVKALNSRGASYANSQPTSVVSARPAPGARAEAAGHHTCGSVPASSVVSLRPPGDRPDPVHSETHPLAERAARRPLPRS